MAFLDKTIGHIFSFAQDVLFNREVSKRKGFLQRVDPRVKLASIVALIIALSFEKHPSGILFFLGASFAVALISLIPPALFIKRLLPAIVFTSLIALPSTLNIVVGGEPVFTLMKFKGFTLTLTKQGLMSASTLVLRAVASLALVFLQTLTTPPEMLIKAVSFFLPKGLRPVFSISYRYIYFLLRRVEEYILAYRARDIGVSRRSAKDGRMWVSSRIGSLFSISLHLSRNLDMAMKSRNYGYDLPTAGVEKLLIGPYDILWLSFTALMLGVAVL